MELIPWRQPGELARLRREMDSLWNRFVGEEPFAGLFGKEWAPLVDVSETKDDVVVKVELPGLDVKDVDVTLSDNFLTIRGEKKKEGERKEEHFHCRERHVGSFQRSFRLPVLVKSEKCDAAFKNGVLTITIPKADEAKKKEIKIKTE